MKKDEYYNRNYDLNEIEEDPRFLVCFKEMLITYGVFFLYLICMIFAAYKLSNVPLDKMTFIMGIPSAWFACIVILLFFIAVSYFVIKKVFKDMDLTDQGSL